MKNPNRLTSGENFSGAEPGEKIFQSAEPGEKIFRTAETGEKIFQGAEPGEKIFDQGSKFLTRGENPNTTGQFGV